MSDGCSLGEVTRVRSSAAQLTAQTTERELLETISAGSCSAMEELYFLHFARLAKFFEHVTGRVDLVEELISDTMFDVCRKSATIGSDASVPVWIMGLAYSHGRMALARAELTRPHGLPSAPHMEHDRALTSTSHQPQGLQDFLLALPFEQRAALHLAYSGRHSRQSIADIMNTSCERVDRLLAQARHRLSYLKEKNEHQQPCPPES
jgi:DNA-directed RNA polymerase specialized sigma24 family protein